MTRRLIPSIRRLSGGLMLGAAAMALIPATAQARDYRRDHDRDRDDDRGQVRIETSSGRQEYRPPVYEDRVERVWVEPTYRTVCDRVWVEPVYRTVCDRVWREPVVQDVCDRVWVEPVYEYRDVVRYSHGRRCVERQRVLVCPGHWEERHRQVIVSEGRWDTIERQELVSEGYWRNVERQEVATPGHWEYRTTRQPVVDSGRVWDWRFGFDYRR